MLVIPSSLVSIQVPGGGGGGGTAGLGLSAEWSCDP